VIGSLPEQNSGWLFHSLTTEWQSLLSDQQSQLLAIEQRLVGENFLPAPERIFAALTKPVCDLKVLIVGQDPYPHRSDAMGLAFSLSSTTQKLPPTLRNIFRELHSDLGGELRTNGDLSEWHEQGVVLLNQSLTLLEGESNSHRTLGWSSITTEIVRALSSSISCAILWGKQALELAPLLDGLPIISGPHPSPLSSYRGFFGSRPFSRANAFVQADGREAIDWLRGS
jgi:uracil-DNA glycosylase